MTVQEDILRAKRRWLLNSEQAIRKALLDLFRSVVMMTPVDQGTLRGSWFVEIGQPSNRLGQPDPGGQRTIAAGQATLLDYQIGSGKIYLVNNQPYALRVEHGWSKQSPAGMLRVNIARMDAFFERAAREVS